MNKHTPGPWAILPEEADKSYIRIRGTQLGGRFKVANVITPVYEDVHPRELAETRANASLIAAAPELLKACEEALDDLVDDEGVYFSGDESLVRQLRSAIAKARGEA